MTSVVEAKEAGDKIETFSSLFQADRRVELILRLGAAACFVGHGAFGLLRKEAWVTYFGVVGIGRDTAFLLMPLIGTIDICAGLLVLISPRPIVLLYMAIWGAWTALLRPFAGESAFETLERAGNYGVPFALLLWYSRPTSLASLFSAAERRPTPDRRPVIGVLLWATASLLFAHGALQTITQKPLFASLYGAVRLPASIAPFVGSIEMIAAVLLLIAPLPGVMIAVAAWKMASESLFPISGTPIWEFVERGGSYAAPLALALLFRSSPFTAVVTFKRSIR
jgi:hypothetical protein